MIYGSHVIVFSADPDADRAFLGDVLGFEHVDAAKGVKFSEVEEARWGSVTRIRLAGGGEVGLYQPRHAAMVEPS